jgi:hypothetical protein
LLGSGFLGCWAELAVVGLDVRVAGVDLVVGLALLAMEKSLGVLVGGGNGRR